MTVTNTYNRSYSYEFPSEYRSILNSWHTHSVDDLMLRWGEPTKAFDIPNGNKVFEYTTDKSEKAFCIARFEVKDNIVIRSDIWGDACSLWREPTKKVFNSSGSSSVYSE